LISFFSHGRLLVRAGPGEQKSIDVGNQYYMLGGPSTDQAETQGEPQRGWQLRILLAAIHNACFERPTHARFPADHRDLEQNLAQAGGAPSEGYFEFGVGYTLP